MPSDQSPPEAAQPGPLSPSEAGRLADMFRLLADPNRTRILYTLLEDGEQCVNDIAGRLELAESSVSHALRLLRIAGVVKNRREGRTIYYSLDDSHVRNLLSISLEHLEHTGDD